jgi:hypothetical protein
MAKLTRIPFWEYRRPESDSVRLGLRGKPEAVTGLLCRLDLREPTRAGRQRDTLVVRGARPLPFPAPKIPQFKLTTYSASMYWRMTSIPRNASAWTSAIYFVSGQLGWFACTLSAARGFPWLGALVVLLLIAAHITRASQPFQELKLIAATALIGAVWESALGSVRLLSYPSGILVHGLAPYWLVALWALLAAQFNTTYTWLKSRLALAALLGAVAGPVSFHAGAALGALKFENPWPAAVALALGWACLLPLIAVISRHWDGVRTCS